MVFKSGGIIRLGSVDFVIEMAEVNCFSVRADGGLPFSRVFNETNADETGGGFFPGFSPIEHILRRCGEAKISPSIIERIAVDVVDEKAFRGLHNFAVQEERFSTSGAYSDISHSIKGVASSDGTPFEGVLQEIILQVNDGKFTFSQSNVPDLVIRRGGRFETKALKDFRPMVFAERMATGRDELARFFGAV
jgi:hypothetical protein